MLSKMTGKQEAGRSGGLARAKALSHRKRSEIARKAALRRWRKPDPGFGKTPRGREAVTALVALGRPSTVDPSVDVPRVCLDALKLCRKDACLMRMMPVFLWRFRERLRHFVPENEAQRRLFGYLRAVAARLSGDVFLVEASRHLPPMSEDGPEALLESQGSSPFAVRRMLAEPDAEASSWGFLLGATNGYFESYFEKVKGL
jgi:hypothetical protein